MHKPLGLKIKESILLRSIQKKIKNKLTRIFENFPCLAFRKTCLKNGHIIVLHFFCRF